MELGQHPQITDRRSWLRTILFQIACFLWILPIAALLTLNFKRHIVGASAWCPTQDCYVGWFNPVRAVPLDNLRDFDRRDHNLLGALQFAAKALEIWFELIAIALVYLITFLIAGKKDGLPIGFLTRPAEFSDVPGLFDPLMWRTLPPLFRSSTNAGGRKYRLRVYLYIGFTVILCILCNLMGPATAVLALPSLQWIDTQPIGTRAFGELNAAIAPKTDSVGPFYWNTLNCTDEDFATMNYSCAADPFASQLDSWIESYYAAGDYVNGLGQEQGVKFSLNQTFSASSSDYANQAYSDLTWWAPNRQTLAGLNQDLIMISAQSLGVDVTEYLNITGTDVSDDIDTYAAYNHSLLLTVQRNGPIIGTLIQLHADLNDNKTWTVDVDSDRQIRCYDQYDLSLSPLALNMTKGVYMKCVRTGSGWTTDNKQVGFTMRGVQDYRTNSTAPDVEVTVFSSDRAQFFKDGELPSWFPAACLQPGQVASSLACDWDKLFYTEPDDPLFNRTQSVVTIEMSTQTNDTNPVQQFQLAIDFVAFLNFTTYQLDPSPISNPMTLVQTHDLPQSGSIIQVDPAWVLAAWTVENNGLLNPDRTAAIEMVHLMNALLRDNAEIDLNLDYMCLLPVIQALSLIDFTTEQPGTASSFTLPSKRGDPNHPVLTRNAKMYVWAYGLGSRTSKLGVVVALAGVAVVLVQIVLGFIDRRKYRSPTQLLVAALEHAPASEFANLEHDEVKVASMRFHVQGTRDNAGKYMFKKLAGRH